MLIELRIRDFAVIEEISVEMGPGLHALSGETGAGKSIIVGALSLLLGERASSENVRSGAAKSSVEAVFDVSTLPAVRDRIDDLGFELDDGLLILRREVVAAGRSRAWVNGSPVTAKIVGELGRSLVDLHGQHEHQTLLRAEDQLRILDAFARVSDQAAEVLERYRHLTELKARLAEMQERRRELEGRADFLRFQQGEIEEAGLQPGEDLLLQEESRRLEHAEELAREAMRVYEELYGGETAIADQVARLRSALERLCSWDPSLDYAVASLGEAYEHVSEVGRQLGGYASDIDQDPVRLEEVRARLDSLFRLMRKYGPELRDVIETGARVQAELEELEGASFDHDAVAREIEARGNELTEVAADLGEARRSAAGRLEDALEELLPLLGLPGAVFQVSFTELPEIGPSGAERAEFLISLNPGFPPRPLSRVASGGELSRVMLALKAILARVDAIPTLVFDEIDAGIGGVVATHVAEQLREVAGHHQVFVVTHLPQLACRADRHLLVEKDVASGVTVARVDALTGDDRVREIARMLGGDPESEASQEHARELLEI
jgi:DNA repair protein RecN (Recombination protein N)